MNKKIIFVLSILFFTLGLQDCKSNRNEDLPINIKEKLIGDWAEKGKEFRYSFCFMDSLATCLFLNSKFGIYKIIEDSLIFRNEFTERNYKDKLAKFKILSINDSLLKLSYKRTSRAENGKLDTIDLYKFSPEKGNNDIYCEKLVIRTSPCFGSCMVYNLEINADRKCYFQGITNVDSIGDYEGYIDTKYFNLIQRAIKYIKYSELKESYSSSATCGQTISLVLYLRNTKNNSLKKYLISIYGIETPVKLNILLNYLNVGSKYVGLLKTSGNHYFECKKEDRDFYDELISYYRNVKN